MRILVVSNLYPPDVLGGYEIGCRQAVDGLIARGHEVRVLTSTPRRPVATAGEPHVARRLSLTDLWYNASRPTSDPGVDRVWEADARLISAHNVHAMIQEIESFRPDVVYAWMLLGIGGLGLIGGLQYLDVPWVWHLMDADPVRLCEQNWRIVPGLAQTFNRLARGRYFACSESLLHGIERAGIRLAGPVELVPNWLTGPRSPARSSSYRPGDVVKIVSAGRITAEKGVSILVDAARDLRDRGIDRFVLDIYGTVFDREVPDLVRRHDLSDRVRFLGPRPHDEMLRLYGEYDLYAFPTAAGEPFGFAPLEAASRGCVPLISQVCGIAEWLVHGVHCLKAPRGAESFANAIAAVIEGRVDLGPIARRAWAAVWRDFHLDVYLPRIERVLAEAASSPRAGGGTFQDAHRMALIGERLAHAIVQEARPA